MKCQQSSLCSFHAKDKTERKEVMSQFLTVAAALIKAEELQHEAHILSLEADAFMHGSDAWKEYKVKASECAKQARAILNRLDED